MLESKRGEEEEKEMPSIVGFVFSGFRVRV